MTPIDLAKVPESPGCYLFKDATGQVIYVGKAKSLRARVSSYFHKGEQSPKTKVLVSHIASAEYILVDNEVEALLLENRLIKQHSPKYNIALKDSKTYAYICITDEAYPRILSVRKRARKGTFFGPYTDGFLRARLVSLTARLFGLRVCRTLPKRACLNYHIDLCSAPCIANISKEDYHERVAGATRFLKGDTQEIAERLRREMKEAAGQQRFEAALERRRQLEAIAVLDQRQKMDRHRDYDEDAIAVVNDGSRAYIEVLTVRKGVVSGKKSFTLDREADVLQSFVKMYYGLHAPARHILLSEPCWKDDEERRALEHYLERLHGRPASLLVPERGDRLGLVKIAEKNAAAHSENKLLTELKEKLILPATPLVIECFDMSNLGPDDLVGGMVQWVNGKPNKGQYRRFAVRSFKGRNDDFAAMQEVVLRRYRRLTREKKPLPDLILIDGGPGQLASALAALQQLGLQVPIVALAKEREELYTPHEEQPLRLDPQSDAMLLVRGIRDSAHRFVISYNRKKRDMRLRDEFKQAER